MDAPETLMLAALGGALVGLLLTLFGGGGSVLATPWLIYVVGVADTHLAIGTSAAAVAVNAAVGLTAQARAGTVKWPCASVFAVAGLAGAMIGAEVGKQTDGAALLNWFALAMIAIAVSMMIPRRSEGDPAVHLSPAMVPKLALAGLGAGLAAGFFGIGGGFLIAPGLMAATGMTIANAAASSLVSVTLFGGATSASYALSSSVDWALFGALVAGGALGTVAAMPMVRWLASRAGVARRLFALMIMAVAGAILIG
ncbi:sulfite exporter TauE/SafE family protein [Sphingomonas sp. BGYR3]|uniref:sulfite exporter TauE/SafE family protein n=1 Tax=Sphingomonas sp. BGYR3 TaxID=2975483 RepID=UPI0021A33D16|nr:sulfite exporter TauE/SafE family protein [Sphingomonas sp. BGYR3]MDG5488072.1 sulfite exporter TauE/SafE family protein [Sphingomonas sp. BGYR3]